MPKQIHITTYESQTHWDVSVYLCHKSSQKTWPLQSALSINISGPKFYKANAVGNEYHPWLT